MTIRLHEIELGVQGPSISHDFYNSILGLETVVDQDNLKVFKSGVTGVDFNTSTHVPPKVVVTSFLTDDLESVIERLTTNGISFKGPVASHLGMTKVEFKDPDGYLIRVNQTGPATRL